MFAFLFINSPYFMLSIESYVESFFLNHAKRNILIAYSGGVDSQVLLHCLASLKNQNRLKSLLRVCHVDHGLSENSAQWQDFATKQCQQLNIPLEIVCVNVKVQAQKSLEALARDARYNALKSSATDGDLIVTGHHSDDQVETFLLALKRGSGLKGLSAMQQEMALGQQLLVRPLLNFSRADIERYAKKHQLSWIEDESNIDERFDRNFLRHQILPKLTQRWPSINSTIARSAEHCFEAQQLLDELAQQDLVKSQFSKNILDTAALLALTQARFNNTLRYFLSVHNILMPSSQQLQQIRLQLSAEGDKSPMVQLANCCLRRYKNELHLTDIFKDLSSWQETVNLAELTETKTLALPDNLGNLTFSVDEAKEHQKHCWQATILAPKPEQIVSISFVHQNPKCSPQYRQHSRSLKKVLQELAIPPWLRKRTPFLFYDGVLVAVIGQFVCKEYLGNETSEGLVIAWES